MNKVVFCLGRVSKKYPHRYYSEAPYYRFKEPVCIELKAGDNALSFFVWLRDTYPYDFIDHDRHGYYKDKDVLVMRLSEELADEEFFTLDGTLGKAFVDGTIEDIYKKYLSK